MNTAPARPPSHRRPPTCSACLLGLLLASPGCKPPPARVPALCSDRISREERDAQQLPSQTWLTLASPSIDLTSMQRSGPLTTACGEVGPSAFSPTFECPGLELEPAPSPPTSVALTDLVQDAAGQGRSLLWAPTDPLPSGEFEGSAAVAVWTDDRLEIHATGAIRGYRDNARLQLHAIGSTPVLILESDRCQGAACTPMVQIVPILGRRFAELPVWDAARGCAGRAQFPMRLEEQRRLNRSTTRRFTLKRSLELTSAGIAIHERLEMRDESRLDDAPSSTFRTVEARRDVSLDGDALYVEQANLWERAISDDGDVSR